jgi:hypothetical protein
MGIRDQEYGVSLDLQHRYPFQVKFSFVESRASGTRESSARRSRSLAGESACGKDGFHAELTALTVIQPFTPQVLGWSSRRA